MKKLKRILSMLLVVCMIFTSQAFVTFAEGMENTEAIVKETTIEETTVKETTAEETIVGESDLVGASSASAETETELTESEEGSHSSPVQGENEPEETTEEAKLNEPETEYAEEPEEDEIETEIRMGELSEPETEAETEVEEKLFGDPPIYTLSLEPNFPEGFSLPEGRSWYEDKSGPLYSDTDSILIEGWNTRICVDTAGNVCNLTGYNTKADGSGTRFSYQESISKEKLEYFDLPSDSYDLVLYAMWRTSELYTIHYNQNLPEGYSLAEGSTWGNDATLWDYVDDFEFEIYDYTGMTCEDSDGKTLALIKWNTAADGTGDDNSFGDWITSKDFFTDGELTLYAVWSEPVAPGPTAFAYWKIDGDDANKTIHYYASAGEGRTAVDFDENGVVYTSLPEDERNSIKKAVFEEPIVATDVRKLFYFFKGLVSITNLGNLDTSNATSFKLMFDNCSAIEELDVSGLETDSLTDTSFMFSECNSLTKLTFGDYFDTSKVTTMAAMFYVCSQMTSVTFESKFDTSKVTNMRNMFCSAGLEELDLTKFDTSNVTDMYGMFSSCENLETIRVTDKFVVDQVTSSNYMFFNTSNLVGEQGTKSTDTATPWDKTYAHIDEGTSNPGLFSGASTPSSDKNFYVLYYANDVNYSTWTLSEKHISASADATAKEAFANDLFNNCIYNLSAAEPRGFYKIGDDTEYSDINEARIAYDRWSDVSVELEKEKLLEEYESWVAGGAANDVYYGTLINTYFYLLHYDSDGNPAFIQVKCTDTEDTVNAYLATIKGSAPSGKKFKTWQYWHADWYEEEGYDYSDDGEKEFYKNLVENPSNFETDADVIEKFNAWTPEPYENRHYGAIYEDDAPTTTYTVKYNQDLPTGYTLSGGMTWYTDSTTTDLTGNPIILKGSADMTCEDTSGNTRTLQSWNTQIEHKGNTFNFGAEFNDPQYFDPDPTCTLYAMWSDPVPPAPTPPSPTPPGPTPPSPGGGETGGGTSGGGSSDPTHGPMGDLTKNPLYADTLNGTNNIPESKMVSNDTLATTLKSYPENVNSPMVNARDDSGNVGYGQWLRVPNTTTWYFLSGSFNQGTGTTNTGFLANGWFNLGWDGQDKWYYFDSAGVMKIGWHQEGNKIYYLQADFSDNWYGKAMTGQQMIGGQIYNFDSNGALIQ